MSALISTKSPSAPRLAWAGPLPKLRGLSRRHSQPSLKGAKLSHYSTSRKNAAPFPNKLRSSANAIWLARSALRCPHSQNSGDITKLLQSSRSPTWIWPGLMQLRRWNPTDWRAIRLVRVRQSLTLPGMIAMRRCKARSAFSFRRRREASDDLIDRCAFVHREAEAFTALASTVMSLCRRSFLCALVLLPRLLAFRTDAADAFEQYNTRLLAIARSYNQQYADIRKGQRRMAASLANARYAEQQVRQLAALRDRAVAEARLNYQKGRKQTDGPVLAKVVLEPPEGEAGSPPAPAEDPQKAFWAKVAREEAQATEQWAARIEAVEGEQKSFWAGVAARESQESELRSAQFKAAEDGQAAFWARVFPAPSPTAHDRTPVAAARTGPQRIDAEAIVPPKKAAAAFLAARNLAAAN